MIVIYDNMKKALKVTLIIFGIIASFVLGAVGMSDWNTRHNMNDYWNGWDEGRDDMFSSCTNYVCDLIYSTDGGNCSDYPQDNSTWDQSKSECLNILFYGNE